MQSKLTPQAIRELATTLVKQLKIEDAMYYSAVVGKGLGTKAGLLIREEFMGENPNITDQHRAQIKATTMTNGESGYFGTVHDGIFYRQQRYRRENLAIVRKHQALEV